MTPPCRQGTKAKRYARCQWGKTETSPRRDDLFCARRTTMASMRLDGGTADGFGGGECKWYRDRRVS